MFINFNIICFFILMCVFYTTCQHPLFEGCECVGAEDGVKGTCVSIRNCLSIVNDLRQKKHPQLCSFKGREPIVCCTDCTLFNDTSTAIVDKYGAHYFKKGPKAADKCLEYMINLNYSCSSTRGLHRGLNPFNEKPCYNYEGVGYTAAVGGNDAQKGEFPHMALLGYGDDLETAQWLCGGSVISERFILTAGHCIGTQVIGEVKYVALGILKRTDPSEQWQRYFVKRIIPHPEYFAPHKYHDIALLEVSTKIKFSRLVLPACLYTGDDYVPSATATGWGALGPRQDLAETLQVVKLQEYTTEECSKLYPPHRLLKYGYDNMIQSCYGDRENIIDTCEGDSGGPLQTSSLHGHCFYEIIGVTSYGRQCGIRGAAGMYTRVSYYVPWIESIVWP